MRLAIFIGCLIMLIMVSRWFTLSQNQKPVPTNPEHFSFLVDESSIADSNFAPAVFDQEVESATVGGAPGAGLSDRSMRLGSKAINPMELVRAEYEIPKGAGKVLMDLKSNMLFEILELPCEDQERTRIQVTTDRQSQIATCNFLSALFPDEPNDRRGSRFARFSKVGSKRQKAVIAPTRQQF